MQYLSLLAKPKNVKEAVVKILSQEWPLSLKQIHYNSARSFGLTVSYQAVHKAIKELVSEEIVVSTGKKYALNKEWIAKMEKLSSTLRQAYSDKQKRDLKDLYKEMQANLAFETPLELGTFLCNTFLHYPNPKNDCSIIHAANIYPPIGLSVTDVSSIIRSAMKNNVFCLIRNSTLMDRFLANFYQLVGFKFKFGADCAGSCDIFVRSDYVCNIYWPKALMKRWINANKNVKSLKDFNLKTWFDLIYKRYGEIYVNINKNSELASKFRKETLTYF